MNICDYQHNFLIERLRKVWNEDMPWCQLKLVSTKYLVLGKDLEEFSYTVWRRTKYPYMVGFLFDKIPVMRNVLLSSARLNYFIYLAALRLLQARVDCWTAELVSVVVCITIPMIVNNLGLVSTQICMSFCKTSSATTETSHNSHLPSWTVVVGKNFYKLDGWLMA